jgi:hypothetical protein
VADAHDHPHPPKILSGHIPEPAGVEERSGKTWGVNVGKRGYLLDLANVQKA